MFGFFVRFAGEAAQKGCAQHGIRQRRADFLQQFQIRIGAAPAVHRADNAFIPGLKRKVEVRQNALVALYNR